MKNIYHGLLYFICCAVFLAGCSGPALLAGTAYTVYADRLPTDDLASIVTGKDCNSVRAEREKIAICQDPAKIHQAALVNTPPVWCYRSLASITCYNRPLENETAELIQ